MRSMFARRTFVALFVVAGAALPDAPLAAQTPATSEDSAVTKPPTVSQVPINGLRVYFEIHGDGKPLVLLHGGIGASEMFGENLTKLARGRQVIAVHLQGHGHTRDIDRPLRYELLADDVAALIEHLGLARVDVMGYSFGGGVALQTAIRHPDLVDRLVVVSSAPLTRDGWHPEVRVAFEQMVADAPNLAAGVKQSPLAQLYPDVNWESLFAKIGELHSRDHDWSDGVASIQAPTMLVFADADAVGPDRIVEFYRLLGGGLRDAGVDGSRRSVARLAIVPGTTHYDILSTSMVADLVAGFLDTQLPQSR